MKSQYHLKKIADVPEKNDDNEDCVRIYLGRLFIGIAKPERSGDGRELFRFINDIPDVVSLGRTRDLTMDEIKYGIELSFKELLNKILQ